MGKRWKPEQLALVADRLMTIRQEQPMLNKRDQVLEAQKVLLSHERKPFNTPSSAYALHDKLLALGRTRLRDKPCAPETQRFVDNLPIEFTPGGPQFARPQYPATPKLMQPSPTIDLVLQNMMRNELGANRVVQRAEMQAMLNATREGIRQDLIDFTTHLIQFWGGQPADMPELKFTSPMETRERLPRILIIGTLPVQHETMKEELKGMCCLEWQDKNKSLHIPKGVSMVFLMADKISHSSDEVMKKSNVPYRSVYGGVTSLVQAVKTYLKTGK